MTDAPWWEKGVVYQVYPRSFQDSNADGIGDLAGIRSRLGYLKWLGVDAVWISPIYPSPMKDFGYDISDYCGIDPVFGSLSDFDALVGEAHGLGLKLILDFVPNHTSDQHPWFIESRASRENPKRDWYIWRDPKPDGGPPNNWISNFGGSAWEFDEASGQYYYHAFLKEQPDLNWRNPAVRAAMHDVLRFWLERGVDGFRVDVIWHLIKDDQFRDNPPNPGYREGQPEIDRLQQVYSADRPEVHDVIAGLRRVLDSYPDRVLIGEIYLPIERLVTYYGKDLSGAQLPFNFQLLHSAWNAKQIAAMIREYEQALPAGGWPNWVLGNHDKPRIASRVGVTQVRIAALLLLTLRGTPTMYYGDEIGLEQVPIPAEDVHDPWEKNEPGLGFGRDPERTPMQWDTSANAGFTTARPWLPLAGTWQQCNVAVESDEAGSLLSFYRALLQLRRKHRALALGSFSLVAAEGDLLAYERKTRDESLFIALNFGDADQPVATTVGQVLLSTHGRTGAHDGTLVLRPHEGILLQVT